MTNGTASKQKFYHFLLILFSIFLCLSSVALCVFYTKQKYYGIQEKIDFLEKEILTLRYHYRYHLEEKLVNKSRNEKTEGYYLKHHFVHRRSIADELREKNEEIRRLGNTVYSLRREMFSLNDRLRVLISYKDDGKTTHCKGNPGPPGQEGLQGPRGPPGQNGRSGYRGMKGLRGQKGIKGNSGDDGKDGLNGINGIPGLPGSPGRKGDKGERGRNGVDGRNGIVGATGLTGLPGQPGTPGRKGMKGARGDCSVMTFDKYKDYFNQYTEKTLQSVTYTVWGSASCPPTGHAVFTGQLSMGRYKGKNLGSTPMCIPKSYKSRRRYKRDVFVANYKVGKPIDDNVYLFVRKAQSEMSLKSSSSKKKITTAIRSAITSIPYSRYLKMKKQSNPLPIVSKTSLTRHHFSSIAKFKSGHHFSSIANHKSGHYFSSIANDKSATNDITQSPSVSRSKDLPYSQSLSKSISSSKSSKIIDTSTLRTMSSFQSNKVVHTKTTTSSVVQTRNLVTSGNLNLDSIKASQSSLYNVEIATRDIEGLTAPNQVKVNNGALSKGKDFDEYEAGHLRMTEENATRQFSSNQTITPNHTGNADFQISNSRVRADNTNFSKAENNTNFLLSGDPNTNLVEVPDNNGNGNNTVTETSDGNSNEIPVVIGPTGYPSGSERKYGYIESTRKYISCAVCHFPGRSSIIMIPSRIKCPATWNEEYRGYLMMYHHGSGQATSLCVNDQALGVSPSSDPQVRDIISQYLTHLRFDCNSFSCPPFYDDLVKCVVCSK